MPTFGLPGSTTGQTTYNVKDFGAVGDLSHDDTSAIQSAIDTVKALVSDGPGTDGGYELLFPPGYYKITDTLDFTHMDDVRVSGFGGRNLWYRNPVGDNEAVAIRYMGTSASKTAVNCGNSQGMVWDGVGVESNVSNYTGVLMSFDSSAATDVFGNRIQNMSMRIISGTTGCILLGLDGNIEFSADNVSFAGAPGGTQVRMMHPTGSGGNAGWSNANSFRSCSFTGSRVTSVLNPGPQTTFVDCTFEPGTSGYCAPIHQASNGQQNKGGPVAFFGCGFWDTVQAAGQQSWVTTDVATTAWGFYGCLFEMPPTGPVLHLSSHSGLVISACLFHAANGGTPNVFDPSHNITNGVWQGSAVSSGAVDNHASVFV